MDHAWTSSSSYTSPLRRAMSLSDALPLPDASPVCGVFNPAESYRSAGPKQVAWDASDEDVANKLA
jgi:hypothetical protein